MPECGSLSLGSVSHFWKGQRWLRAQEKRHMKPFSSALGAGGLCPCRPQMLLCLP